MVLITYLFIYYLFVILLMGIFDLADDSILLLFYYTLLSCQGQIFCYALTFRRIKEFMQEKTYTNVLIVLGAFSSLYILIGVSCLIDYLAPKCRTNNIYPIQFKMMIALQVPSWIMMQYIYRNNFFIKPEFKTNKENMTAKQKYLWFCQPAEDRRYSILEMFENQKFPFRICATVNLIFSFTILIVYLVNEANRNIENPILRCNGPYKWMITNKLGGLFVLFHTGISIFNTMLAQRIFFSIPKKFN